MEKLVENGSGTADLDLAGAILVYSGRQANGKETAYATAHGVVVPKSGKPYLSAGSPVTKNALHAALRALAGDSESTGYIPGNVLSVGPGHIVWWSKPCKRTVFFREEGKGVGIRTGSTPHPGLVFAATEGKLYVFAVRGGKRPEPDTRLFLAPYYNVYENGAVCTGSMRIPEGTLLSRTEEWERSFFSSEFTHPNVHGKLVEHPGGAAGLWTELLGGKHGWFPGKALVRTEETVSGLISMVSGGGKT